MALSGQERREQIQRILNASKEPVAGMDLAKQLKVSRQVVVQDIALIRANGVMITSTNRGYVLQEKGTVSRVFKMLHTDDQVEEELNIFVDFGAKYNNSSIAGVGLGTAVDSLLAIKKLVFDERILTLSQLNAIMKDNWAGQEALRLTVKNKYPKYGMGNPEADRYAAALVKELARQINGQPNARGGKYRLGMFTITSRWEMGAHLAATPDGRLAGETTSLNSGASFGADREGVTGQILSVTAIDAADSPNAVVLDVDLHSSAVKGENGLEALYATLKTYLERGGFAIHYNILNADTLRAAQKRPEDYPNLQVRVCGWNMLFSRLPKHQQDEYITRSERIS